MQGTITAPTTIQDLTTIGFSTEEIRRLEALKTSYDPYREHCESNREYEQLCFLKWRYERGEIREAITG